MDTKPWYKSKTIWGGLYTLLRGIYQVLVVAGPAVGIHVPPLPPVVDTIVTPIVGAGVVYGRASADTILTR